MRAFFLFDIIFLMNEVNFLAEKIYSSYGAVKRARGCFLYTAKGVRLTDLYQEGGRSILGWGSEYSSAFRIFKNILSRGITGSFDTFYSPLTTDKIGKKSQLSKAVSSLLNSERSVFFCSSKQKALKAAVSVDSSSTFVYRPWNPEFINWAEVSCVIIEPPLSWATSLCILAIKSDSPELESKLLAIKDDCDLEKVPAPLCSAITRSIYDLISALQNREEKDWFVYDKVLTKYWTRKGPYLFPKVPKDKYNDFIEHCLNCEIVISPIFVQPSIVPYKADFGVFKKLLNNPFLY